MRRLLILAVIVTGCARLMSHADLADPFQVAPIIRTACDELDGFHTYQDLVDAFGNPLSDESEQVPNPNADNQMDQLHSVAFSQADTRFIASSDAFAQQHPAHHVGGHVAVDLGDEVDEAGSTASPPIFLTYLRIHSPGHALAVQEWIGKPISEFLDSAGPPDDETKNERVYSCGETSMLGVETEGGVVLAIVSYPIPESTTH